MLLATVRRLLILLGATVALWSSPPAEAAAAPVIAAAGDIACSPSDPGYNGGAGTADRCRQRATSDLLVNAGLAAVLPLGDIQYESATLSNINTVYHPTWGRVKSISRPVLGNHEGNGNGYFDYFNGSGAADGPAGPRGKGWYSFNVGDWHLIALNSNCSPADCAAGSEQERWLRADLAAHPSGCTLAYWHHPRYSSGHDGNTTRTQPLWEALSDAGVELLLSGHSHNYERIAPLDRNGTLDWARGIRQFVVGTGGAFFTGGLSSRIPHSQVAQNTTFGVLKLTLHPSSYEWQFVPEAGRTYTDQGSTACHGPWPPRPPAGPGPDRRAPVISRVSLSPRRFKVKGRKRGATFRYTLSEAASVRFSIRRKHRGRRVGRRCLRTTRANRRRRPCIRYGRPVAFVRRGVTGRNSRRFTGRIGRRALRPGVYLVTLVATDGAGNRSGPRRVRFRILRR
jgi:acid phosphatase type 7